MYVIWRAESRKHLHSVGVDRDRRFFHALEKQIQILISFAEFQTFPSTHFINSGQFSSFFLKFNCEFWTLESCSFGKSVEHARPSSPKMATWWLHLTRGGDYQHRWATLRKTFFELVFHFYASETRIYFVNFEKYQLCIPKNADRVPEMLKSDNEWQAVVFL